MFLKDEKRIEKTIRQFVIVGCLGLLLCSCGQHKKKQIIKWQADEAIQSGTEVLSYTDSMELSYATQFHVDYYEDYTLLTIVNGERYLLIPEGKDVPQNLDDDIKIVYQPLEKVYLAATSVMADFDVLDGIDQITYSSQNKDGWTVENAKQAMDDGTLIFAGKYSEPDYEMLVSGGCTLAIESTMISHAPEVKEKLEELGITVFTDYSSYEKHPLGRTEWMKLYGAMLGKTEIAEAKFEEQMKHLEKIEQPEEKKTVAFFYISSAGTVVARKTGDYVTSMIDMAGGTYVFDKLGDSESAMSTVKIDMEQFYATAKDADYIVYNSTIDDSVKNLDDFVKLNSVLKDFKAVKEGNVWITKQNFYQDTTRFGEAIEEMSEIFSGNQTENTEFFVHVK